MTKQELETMLFETNKSFQTIYFDKSNTFFDTFLLQKIDGLQKIVHQNLDRKNDFNLSLDPFDKSINHLKSNIDFYLKNTSYTNFDKDRILCVLKWNYCATIYNFLNQNSTMPLHNF